MLYKCMVKIVQVAVQQIKCIYELLLKKIVPQYVIEGDDAGFRRKAMSSVS